jgi:hypothetical protein
VEGDKCFSKKKIEVLVCVLLEKKSPWLFRAHVDRSFAECGRLDSSVEKKQRKNPFTSHQHRVLTWPQNPFISSTKKLSTCVYMLADRWIELKRANHFLRVHEQTSFCFNAASELINHLPCAHSRVIGCAREIVFPSSNNK